MKVELEVTQAWASTEVIIEGYKIHVEKIVQAIKDAFKDDTFAEIK